MEELRIVKGKFRNPGTGRYVLLRGNVSNRLQKTGRVKIIDGKVYLVKKTKISYMTLHTLPIELTEYILSFVDGKDIISFSSIDSYHRKFISSLKHRDSWYIRYNREIANSYIYKMVQKVYLDRLPSKKSQKILKNAYIYLRRKRIRDLPRFFNVHTLDLGNAKITKVTDLGDIHTLNLENTRIYDASSLGRIHTLNLAKTDVEDVSALGNVHTLNISFTKVTDISCLDNVQKLLFAQFISNYE